MKIKNLEELLASRELVLHTYYKKYLREYKDEKIIKKLLEHKVLWTYTTLYMKEYRSFVFSKDGVLSIAQQTT